MLEFIPGQIIAKAAAMLPDAESASDEARYVEVPYRRGWICITFRRFMYTWGTTACWHWTAESAALVERDRGRQ